MTMVSSGPISIGGSATTGELNQSVNIEILRPASATVNVNDVAVRSLAGAPSGAVALSACYGKTLPGTRFTPSVARDIWRGAVFGGSTYVVAGWSIWSSTDATNWTVRQPLFRAARGCAWSGSVFVVVGEGGFVFSSPDGITWTARTSGTTLNLLSIAWSGSIFVAVGASGVILSSPDGVTWTSRTSGTTNNINAVAWGNGTFVAVTTNSSDSIRRSADGINWTTPSPAVTGANGNTIAFGLGLFVVLGNNRMTNYSTDGLTWSSGTSTGAPTNLSYQSVIYAGNRFLAGTFSTTGPVASIYSSTNGINWTSQNTNPTTSEWNTVSCWLSAPGRVMGFGDGRLNNSAAVVTTDGGTTVTNLLTGNNNGLLCIASSGSRFVAGGFTTNLSGTNSLMYSNDGVTWVSTTYGRQVNCIVFGGGRFVVSGPSGFTATSTDGVTFTPVTNASTTTFSGLAYNGTVYVCVGLSGTITTSPDGATWTLQTSGTTESLTGAAWSGSIFVVVGSGGAILTSPDGTTWTLQTSGTTDNFRAVAWGNGSFVAVGDTVSSSIITTSPDGVTWTARLTDTAHFWQSVAWTGGAFVVFGGYNNANVGGTMPNLGSTDLVNWNPITVLPTNPSGYFGVAAVGTTLATVSRAGGIVLSTLPSSGLL